jgi:hypothetical protein
MLLLQVSVNLNVQTLHTILLVQIGTYVFIFLCTVLFYVILHFKSWKGIYVQAYLYIWCTLSLRRKVRG